MEDISTIGDPAFYNNNNNDASSKKETITIGGYSIDYDYTGAFNINQGRTAVSSVAATGTKSSRSEMITAADFDIDDVNNSVAVPPPQSQSLPQSTDQSMVFSSEGDPSFEEQYLNNNDTNTMIIEVDAPSGKLGLIIDTPNGGIPMVQAMKKDSILNTKVKVGDLLVSVNGIDIRRMSASRVGQLISLHSINPLRSLVFVRNNYSL